MIIRWDPRKHPRDLFGRFKEIFDRYEPNLQKAAREFERARESGEWEKELVPGQQARRNLAAKATRIKLPHGTVVERAISTHPETHGGKPVLREAAYYVYPQAAPGEEFDRNWLPGRERYEIPEEAFEAAMESERAVERYFGDDTLRIATAKEEIRAAITSGVPTIRTRLDSAIKILEQRQFKTITAHDDVISNGLNDPARRHYFETETWPEFAEEEDWPIYGYISDEEDEADIITEQYGNVFFELHDSEIERMTFTLGDSLTGAQPFHITDIPDEVAFEYGHRGSAYLEFQLFGGLEIPDDIKAVVYRGELYDEDDGVDMLESLASDLGIDFFGPHDIF